MRGVSSFKRAGDKMHMNFHRNYELEGLRYRFPRAETNLFEGGFAFGGRENY